MATVDGDLIRVSKYQRERKFFWEESEGLVFRPTPLSTAVSWSRVTVNPNDMEHASARNFEIGSVGRERYEELKERILRINAEKDRLAKARETIRLVKEIFTEYDLKGK